MAEDEATLEPLLADPVELEAVPPPLPARASKDFCQHRLVYTPGSLTLAVLKAELDGLLRVLGAWTRLVRAITHAISKIHIGAIACHIALCASELRLRYAEHV